MTTSSVSLVVVTLAALAVLSSAVHSSGVNPDSYAAFSAEGNVRHRNRQIVNNVAGFGGLYGKSAASQQLWMVLKSTVTFEGRKLWYGTGDGVYHVYVLERTRAWKFEPNQIKSIKSKPTYVRNGEGLLQKLQSGVSALRKQVW